MTVFFPQVNKQRLSISAKLLNKNKQQGSALMMAVFIMVVLMLLGITLTNILSTSSEAIAQEVIGTRALAASNSGMQGHIQKLFPLKGNTSQCNLTSYEYNFDGVVGLYQCKAFARCENYANHSGVAYYRLTSTGECGSGSMETDSKHIVISSRTVQVEARRL